jgi:hypothetical protein
MLVVAPLKGESSLSKSFVEARVAPIRAADSPADAAAPFHRPVQLAHVPRLARMLTSSLGRLSMGVHIRPAAAAPG